MSDIGKSVKSAAGTSTIVLNDKGQTSGQITAQAAFSNAVSLLNSQSGDRFLFSGRTTDMAATVPADVMLNGTGMQAGLTQLINERLQADQGVANMAHLAVSSPPLTTTVTSLAEDGSSFGLKLGAVTSSLTGATVTQPAGAPPRYRRSRRRQSERWRQDHLQLQSARWHHRADRADGDDDDSAAALVPDRRRYRRYDGEPAGCADVFGQDAERYFAGRRVRDRGIEQFLQRVGHDRRHRRQQPGYGPAPITGATLLSGAAATDSLAASFAAGDTITVNGTPITFVASGATGNQLNITDSVQTLLTKINSITGTARLDGDRRRDRAAWRRRRDLTISSSNTAAFAALGFSGTASANPAPLRVNGPPFDTATNLIAGTPSNTVSWYTGEHGTDSARGTAIARVDQSITVQYGARANEQALRYQLQNIAVYAAVTTNATNPNAKAQVNALQQRISANLAPQTGQQSIQDMQAEFAGAQNAIKASTDRQTQLKGMAQTMLDPIEGINQDEVATKILALQTSLQASYQTTSMLYQTTLTKYLPV